MRYFAIFFALLGIWAPPARALPRYTAIYGQNCVLCHQNPTGGGLRSSYASEYLVPREISARQWASPAPDFRLAENVTIGADLRTLAYHHEGGDGEIFAMQGAFYIEVQLSTAAVLYLEQGLSGRGEAYGLWRDLRHGVYVKVGRFIPDHGWRFADHQMFTRRFLWDNNGSDNPAFLYDSGLEVGGSVGEWLDYTASALSGRESHGDNYAGRVLLRQELAGWRLGLGASVIRRFDRLGHRRAVAGFWYVSHGALTWLGEIDETERPGSARLGNLLAQEVTVRLARGWELRGTYSFQDPDRSRQTGARSRTGVGVAYMPQPWFGVQLMGNDWRVQAGPEVSGNGYREAELMMYFFY